MKADTVFKVVFAAIVILMFGLAFRGCEHLYYWFWRLLG